MSINSSSLLDLARQAPPAIATLFLTRDTSSLRHEYFQGIANEGFKVFAVDYGIEHSVL